jgi:hypothetical protein
MRVLILVLVVTPLVEAVAVSPVTAVVAMVLALARAVVNVSVVFAADVQGAVVVIDSVGIVFAFAALAEAVEGAPGGTSAGRVVGKAFENLGVAAVAVVVAVFVDVVADA